MLTASVLVMLIGRADQGFSTQLRAVLDDALAPAYMFLDAPIAAAQSGTGALGHLFTLSTDNAQLRAENDRLRQWQAVAMALEAQNNALKATLHFVPPPAPLEFTSTVVADAGGVYARSVLVVVPPQDNEPQNLVGAVALDGNGVAGRLVEAGDHSARVLLITDINSRIPVAIGPAGAPALMAGTNGSNPSLLYWSPGQPPAEGDAVLTSAQGGAFPAGLPVGVVHYDGDNNPEVLPLAGLPALRLLRLYAYPSSLPVLTPIPHSIAKPAHKPVPAPAHAPHRRKH